MAGEMHFDGEARVSPRGSMESSTVARAPDSACAIVLAGGAGTRIRHLYPDLPKPMVPAAGLPFIEWVLRYLREQGLTQFVVSLGHLAAVAESYFACRPVSGCHIKTVREPAPLGTGGALIFAAGATGRGADPLLLANGDSLVLADLSPAWRILTDESVDGVVVGLHVDDATPYGGLETTGDGRLLRFSEKRPGAGLINAGVYLFRRRLLDKFPSQSPLSLEQDVFPTLLAGGARLMVHRCQAPFLDIGTPESIWQADSFVRRHFVPKVAA